MVIDKRNIISRMSPELPVSIEIGVGDSKHDSNAIGVDILDTPAADIVGDALEVIAKMPSNSVLKISSFHAFEHVPNVEKLLGEMKRVLIPTGMIIVSVPHFSNPFFFSDPTHRNFFGLYTFSYYCNDRIFRRRVPGYIRDQDLELTSVKLIFKSFPPRYFAHGMRKVFQTIFNLSHWMQEIYEDSFSKIMPCYEIHFEIQKRCDDGSRSDQI